jgi:hypothetical protein
MTAAAIYHVQTPYHALQALALAAVDEVPSQLVAVPSHPSQGILLDALSSLPNSPFDAVHRLDAVRPALRRLPQTHARRLSAVRNGRDLRRLVTEAPEPVEVRTANVQTVEGRMLVAAASAAGGRAAVIEDGLLTYEKRYVAAPPSRGVRRRLAGWSRQAYLGRWAASPAGQIPYEQLDALWVSFPEAIDPAAWPGVPVRPIPDPATVRPLLESLAAAVVDPVLQDAYRQLEAIVVLPHSTMLDGAEAEEALGRLIDELVDSGLTVGIKRHPRDDPAAFGRYLPSTITVIEPSLPVELIFLLPGSSVRWIVTDRTTAVLSGPRYRPTARTITFSNGVPPEVREAYERLMRATGGVLVDAPDAARKAITGHV